MHKNQTVFIVDDDPSVRDALGLYLGVQDYRVQLFGDAESFLKAYKPTWSGCALIDIRMPNMDGLTLQKRLRELGSALPVIIMTGHGDVSSAREAFRASAVDFLEKPLVQEKLLQAINEALALQQQDVRHSVARNEALNLFASLTPRETEVMEFVVGGKHNRDIAAELGISTRTVEVHKARMMDKLGVNSVADLVRMRLQIQLP